MKILDWLKKATRDPYMEAEHCHSCGKAVDKRELETGMLFEVYEANGPTNGFICIRCWTKNSRRNRA